MWKHFHTEKSEETFILFDLEIWNASNVYEGKYLSQSIPLPNINKIFLWNTIITKINEHCYGHFILPSFSSNAWIFESCLFISIPWAAIDSVFQLVIDQACMILAFVSCQQFLFSYSLLRHVNIQHELLTHMTATLY